ncbi:MAG: hypothetical protein LBV40_02375 [Methanomicrobiales archaeon]|jgi:hypothetical protein|nr:hypothetical protein [Methanomicrobiales archaeon]
MLRPFSLFLILFIITIFPVLADDNPPVLLFYASGGYLEEKGKFISGNLQAILDGSDDELPILVAYGGIEAWKGIRYVTRSMLLDDSRNGIFGDDTKTLYQNEAVSMGDPKTLSTFLRYVRDIYPYDRLWLILIGHGDAYEGLLLDENHGDDMLSTSELGIALAESGTNIELIGFDACLMATLEMATEVDGYASWMIASQETEPGMGWDYYTWLSDLTTIDEIQLPDAAFSLLQAYMDQKEPGKTLSILFLDETASASHSLGELARALLTLLKTPEGVQHIEAALLDTAHFGLTDTMELVPVTLDILSFTNSISTTIPYLSSLAKTTEEAVDKMIIRSRRDSAVSDAHGISLISPLLMTPDIYAIYSKQNAVHRDWNIFLEQYAQKHPALALSQM